MHEPSRKVLEGQQTQSQTTDSTEPAPEVPEKLNSLQSDDKQSEYRKAYLEQLLRMSFPGCGEDPALPFLAKAILNSTLKYMDEVANRMILSVTLGSNQ